MDTFAEQGIEVLTVDDKRRILEGYIYRRFVLGIDPESTRPQGLLRMKPTNASPNQPTRKEG